MPELIRVETAINQILSEFSPMAQESLETRRSLGRVISSDVLAIHDLPYFDNSTMDGFVLRAEDTLDILNSGPKRFHVVDDIEPGASPNCVIKKGKAARIVTGAMIPSGGDAVIPVEETNIKRWKVGSVPAGSVIVNQVVKKGENIRFQGSFVNKGNLILKKGTILKPQDIGIIASQGISEIKVYKKPRIGMFSTGNEVLKNGETYKEGKIHDINSPTLEALIQKSQCECIRIDIKRDDEKNIQSALDDLREKEIDLIITSGGVSMGAHDYVRHVIDKEGMLKLWRVNMRPGKPLLFGSYKNIPFIGLPGNPVSAFIGFIIFVKPVLQRLLGLNQKDIFNIDLRLTQDIESDGRESYIRAVINKRNGDWYGKPLDNQDSGNIFSLVEANALIKIPQDIKYLSKDSLVKGCILDDI